MKRLLLSLGMLLGVIGGFHAESAKAATPLQTVTNGGVTCSQYSTGFASFPKTIWDCVHPAAPTGQENSIAGAAQGIQTTPVNLQANLTNVQIYTFVNASDFKKFFPSATTPAANAFGATTTNVAAAFSQATQNGATVDLTNVYSGSIVQELAHLVDAAHNPVYSSNAVFTTAIAYDQAYLNAQGNAVWPAAYYTKYPGKTNWQIFQAIYPSANTDIFNYQFQALQGASSTLNDLRLALSFMPSTSGWIKDNVYIATPVTPATARGGVLCTRIKTIYQTFPSVYYNCVHPYNAAGAETHLADTINQLQPANLGVQLRAAATNVYIMLDDSKFVAYFQAQWPNSYKNVYGDSSTTLHVSATFEQIFTQSTQGSPTVQPVGSAPVASPYMNGSIIHELGHQLDSLWGSPSTKAAWTNLATPDFNNMNSPDGVTRRPCTDVFQQATCNKYNLLTTSNAQIFFNEYPHSNLELFAEIFEHHESNSVQPELENALTFLPQMNAYMTGVLAKAVPDGTP